MALALWAVLQDLTPQEIEKRVAELVVELGADDVDRREAAQKALVALGHAAHDPARALFESATDPEVRARLGAVLKTLLPLKEEADALDLIAKNAPFPRSKVDKIKFDFADIRKRTRGTRVDFIDQWTEQTGIAVDVYREDDELKRLLEQASSGYSTSTPKDTLLSLVSKGLDAAAVVDGDRVVVVRLSMPVFLALAARDLPSGDPHFRRLPEFNPRDRSVAEYVLNGIIHNDVMDPQADRWLTSVCDVARDATADDRERVIAVRCLGEIRWDVDAWPRVSEIPDLWKRLAESEDVPPKLAAAAAQELALRRSTKPESLVEWLESPTPALKTAALQALYRARAHWTPSVVRMPTRDETARREALLKQLELLRESPIEDISSMAVVVATGFGDREAARQLARGPDSDDPAVMTEVIDALTRADLSSAEARFKKYADPGLRAAFALRLSDVPRDAHDDAMRIARELLADVEPVVRAAAADSLARLCNMSPPERRAEAIEALRGRLAGEKDERVLKALKRASESVRP